MQTKVMSAPCPDHHNILVATVKKKEKIGSSVQKWEFLYILSGNLN